MSDQSETTSGLPGVHVQFTAGRAHVTYNGKQTNGRVRDWRVAVYGAETSVTIVIDIPSQDAQLLHPFNHRDRATYNKPSAADSDVAKATVAAGFEPSATGHDTPTVIQTDKGVRISEPLSILDTARYGERPALLDGSRSQGANVEPRAIEELQDDTGSAGDREVDS